MKKLLRALSISLCISTFGYAQHLQPMAKKEFAPADTASYQIVENIQNIDVYGDLEIRKKIEGYRKKETDFLLDFGNGLKILIYKEEE